MEDTVLSRLYNAEIQVKVMADDYKRLQDENTSLKLALDLAQSNAYARYHHWSYQTYLFLRWFFGASAKAGRHLGYVYLDVCIKTPLVGFLIRRAARSYFSAELENRFEVYWMPNLPIETGEVLYKHAWSRSKTVVKLSEHVVARRTA